VSDPAAPRRRGIGVSRRRSLRGLLPALGLLPFFLIVLAFLGVPLYYMIHGAFTSTDALTGKSSGLTLHNFSQIFSQSEYLKALKNSVILSIWTSIGPAIFGLWFAAAVVAGNPNGLLRRITSAVSGVLAYFSGAPLAFVVIAAFGANGVITVILKDIFHWFLPNSISTASLLGVGLTYFMFQIPLMVIFVTPALEGLKPEWEEAARNLGATRLRYLRQVVVPVLTPSVVAATLLLFGSSFSAFATALALDGGGIDVTPTRINLALSNNVLQAQTNLAEALGTEMIAVVGIVMVLYWLAQRRAGRWMR
jgi:putative spermidine/putrescine transport system permease protein